ncbi:hypothetical protein NHX12_006195, partial [Muraenolepis orangiensis]
HPPPPPAPPPPPPAPPTTSLTFRNTLGANTEAHHTQAPQPELPGVQSQSLLNATTKEQGPLVGTEHSTRPAGDPGRRSKALLLIVLTSQRVM